MEFIAPLLLVPILVAVDHLVELGSVRRRPQRSAELANALVADLKALVRARAVGPGVIRDRIGDRLVLLMTQPTAELGVPKAVGVITVVAKPVARDIRIVRVDQKRRDAGVLVIRAEERQLGGLDAR